MATLKVFTYTLTEWIELYEYTADLMCLDFCRNPQHRVPTALRTISTPLNTSAWVRALSSHPDQAFARYITNGLQEGFRIGFKWGSPLRSARSNMHSACQHPQIITEYLQKEQSLGRMLGPFKTAEVPTSTHINRFGVIPKGHETGKWRLITDLSYPPAFSVNDGINPILCSLTYTSVDEVADIVAQLGRGSLLAKVDIEAAYRLIPVHPQDRPLQAVQWENRIYIDPMLPFGLRSAPKIFNAVADALHWYLQNAGIPHLKHYLDDFIIIAPPLSPLCSHYLDILNRECQRLGVPIADHKRDGPTTCLTFLGIEIDTEAGQLWLPADKLARLVSTLREWEYTL